LGVWGGAGLPGGHKIKGNTIPSTRNLLDRSRQQRGQFLGPSKKGGGKKNFGDNSWFVRGGKLL